MASPRLRGRRRRAHRASLDATAESPRRRRTSPRAQSTTAARTRSRPWSPEVTDSSSSTTWSCDSGKSWRILARKRCVTPLSATVAVCRKDARPLAIRRDARLPATPTRKSRARGCARQTGDELAAGRPHWHVGAAALLRAPGVEPGELGSRRAVLVPTAQVRPCRLARYGVTRSMRTIGPDDALRAYEFLTAPGAPPSRRSRAGSAVGHPSWCRAEAVKPTLPNIRRG